MKQFSMLARAAIVVVAAQPRLAGAGAPVDSETCFRNSSGFWGPSGQGQGQGSESGRQPPSWLVFRI